MIYIVGTGPGKKELITEEGLEIIKKSEIIVGYGKYLELIEDLIEDKEIIQTGMKKEIDRCTRVLEISKEGKDVVLVSGGDPGVYAMAGLVLELNDKLDFNQEIKVIPGVTSSLSASASLGAPLMHDFCHISLSDLLTPWELIEKRLNLASEADFVICIYNPRSKGRPKHLEKAIEIIKKYKKESTPVGIVKNSGRENEEVYITNLKEFDDSICDMSTIVIIGNKQTYISNNKIITPRGYEI